ncbi:MAG: alpha/beta hydrolase [Lachnospiraceae bacterium]|nr:alpha/beta hydrolase [Lachnospiraceae bacterium]
MIVYILSCMAVFFLSWSIGSKVAVNRITDEKLGDLKVKWNEKIGTVYEDVSYGEKELNRYDLYLPANREKDSYSLIFHIHGGGFNSGDKSEGEILCKFFASEGYVAVSANYSLMDESHSSNLNVMYEELVAALEHAVSGAEEAGYPVTEMAVTGESAGGCLAMLLAFRYGDSSDIPVRFVFQESGPASFQPDLWASATEQGQVDFVNSMTGRKFTVEDLESEEYRMAIDEISPASYIHQDTVPLLLAYGSNDKIVPPNIKIPLLQALEDQAAVYEYIEFPNSGHGLLNDPERLREYHKKMLEFADRYFENNKTN